jgi:hypothetical protein
MKPNHLLRLMELIDTDEDAEQIRRWGRQSDLLARYAWNRIVAIYSRRTGNIQRALDNEAVNDRRYAVVSAIAKRYDRCL